MDLNLTALIIGIMATAAIYFGLQRAIGGEAGQSRRALGVFAGAAGFITYLYLAENPDLLMDTTFRIVSAAILVILGLLALARRGVR